MDGYTYIRTVGEGAYGDVWLTQRRGGSYCAVKVFKQAHEDAEIKALAKREARVLQSISHINCVQLLDAFKSKSGRVYLVFEYVPRNVFGELDANPYGLPSSTTKLVTWQLLHAVAYLHERKIVHRDIKPANILLTDEGVVKLCDFGFARATRCGPRELQAGMSTYCVTRWYRPPEVLVSDSYGPSADVWSIGCTIAEVATGRPLFPGRSTPDQLWRIMRCLGPLAPQHLARLLADEALRGVGVPQRSRSLRQRLPELEPRLFQLVEACLAPNPALRPTAAELLQMPYFWDVQSLVAGTPLAGLYAAGRGGGGAAAAVGAGKAGGGGGAATGGAAPAQVPAAAARQRPAAQLPAEGATAEAAAAAAGPKPQPAIEPPAALPAPGLPPVEAAVSAGLSVVRLAAVQGAAAASAAPAGAAAAAGAGSEETTVATAAAMILPSSVESASSSGAHQQKPDSRGKGCGDRDACVTNGSSGVVAAAPPRRTDSPDADQPATPAARACCPIASPSPPVVQAPPAANPAGRNEERSVGGPAEVAAAEAVAAAGSAAKAQVDLSGAQPPPPAVAVVAAGPSALLDDESDAVEGASLEGEAAAVLCAITGPQGPEERPTLISPVAATTFPPTTSSPSTAAAVPYVRTQSVGCSPPLPLPTAVATAAAVAEPEQPAPSTAGPSLERIAMPPPPPPVPQLPACLMVALQQPLPQPQPQQGDSEDCAPGEECDWVSELRETPNPRVCRVLAARHPAAVTYQALLTGDAAAAWQPQREHAGGGAASEQLPTAALNSSVSAAALTFSTVLPAALGMDPVAAAESSWLSCQPLGPILRAAVAASMSVDGAGGANGSGSGAGSGGGGSDSRLGRLPVGASAAARRTAAQRAAAGRHTTSALGAAPSGGGAATVVSSAHHASGTSRSGSGSGMDVASGFLRPFAATMAARAAAGNRIALQAAAAAAPAAAGSASWRISLGGGGGGNFAFPAVSAATWRFSLGGGGSSLLNTASSDVGGTAAVGGGGATAASDTLPLGEPLRGAPVLSSCAAVPPPHRRPPPGAAPWMPPAGSASNSESLFHMSGLTFVPAGAARGGGQARTPTPGGVSDPERPSPPTDTEMGAVGSLTLDTADGVGRTGSAVGGGGGSSSRATSQGGLGLMGAAWGALVGRFGRSASSATTGGGGSAAAAGTGPYSVYGAASAGGGATMIGSTDSVATTATAATAIPAGPLMRRSQSNRSGRRHHNAAGAAAVAVFGGGAARSRLASAGSGTWDAMAPCSGTSLATSPGGGGGAGSAMQNQQNYHNHQHHHRNRHNLHAGVPTSIASVRSNDSLSVLLAAGVQLSPVEGGVNSSAFSMVRPLSALSRSREPWRGPPPLADGPLAHGPYGGTGPVPDSPASAAAAAAAEAAAAAGGVVGSFGGGGGERQLRPPSRANTPTTAPATPIPIGGAAAGTDAPPARARSGVTGGAGDSNLAAGSALGAGAGACERPSAALASTVLGAAQEPGCGKAVKPKKKKGLKALWKSMTKALGLT